VVEPANSTAGPSPPSKPTGDPASRLSAGAAGAGSGTLLVLLANNLPSTSPWKGWLVIVAPSATVFATFVWAKLSIMLTAVLRTREFNKLVERARRTLVGALDNKATSPEHREKLKGELEQLELLLVQTDVEKIRTMRVP